MSVKDDFKKLKPEEKEIIEVLVQSGFTPRQAARAFVLQELGLYKIVIMQRKKPKLGGRLGKA